MRLDRTTAADPKTSRIRFLPGEHLATQGPAPNVKQIQNRVAVSFSEVTSTSAIFCMPA